MVDSKGVLFRGRKEGINIYKEPCQETSKRTLMDAMEGADLLQASQWRSGFHRYG